MHDNIFDENDEYKIIKYIQSFKKNDVFDKIMKFSSNILCLKYYIVILFILALYNKLNNKDIFVIMCSFVAIISFKNLIARQRPFDKYNVEKLDECEIDKYSFPSGHTFFAIVLTFILKKKLNIDIKYFPYLVGLSRVYLGSHYPSDILGSFLITKIISKSYSFIM
jgi:undecaprenyl-diphosphatase